MTEPSTAAKEPPATRPAHASGSARHAGGWGITDAVVFAVATVYYLTYPHLGFFGIVPDNVTQVAYFQVLREPALAGVLGSATPKAGLIALLGGLHQLTYGTALWDVAFRVLLAVFAGLSVMLVTRIARDLGGARAAGLALVVALGVDVSANSYFHGTSQLFFVPALLLGLRWLSQDRHRAAAIVLGVAALVRPEALFVLAAATLHRFVRRAAWRPLIEAALVVAVASLVFAVTARMVQGSWERAAAGPAVGYPMDAEFGTGSHLGVLLGRLFDEPVMALLLGLALYAALTRRRAGAYLYGGAIVVVPLALASMDVIGLHYRYIAGLQLLVIPLGCAGTFLLSRDVRRGRARRRVGRWGWVAFGVSLVLLGGSMSAHEGAISFVLPLLAPAVVAGTSFVAARTRRSWPATCGLAAVAMAVAGTFLAVGASTRAVHQRWIDEGIRHPVVRDWWDVRDQPMPPRGAAVLAEDPLLSYVVALDRGRFGGLRSIQAFNVAPDEVRRRWLSECDYLWLSRRERYRWYYLSYLPVESWRDDSFRAAMEEMIRAGMTVNALGRRLIPLAVGDDVVVARIE